MDISDKVSEYEGTVSPLTASLQRPLGFKLRFTFSDQDKEFKCHEDKQFINRAKVIHTNLLQKLVDNQYIYDNKITSGFEVLNKLGERTHAHIHMAFFSTHQKESIRRTIKRYLTDAYDQDTTGNKCLSFVVEPDLRCEDKFFRYPLKQLLDMKMCRGFSPEKLLHYHAVAKESYAITCQVHQSKADKADTTDTLFSRLTEFLKKVENQNRTSLRIATSKFYCDESRPLNRQTMTGYVDTYMLQNGLLTHEQYWGNE